MEENKATEVWNNAWKKSVHKTEYARKRIKSAKSAKLTPIKIDTTDLYGYFESRNGQYETFLNYCPCGDFRRSKLPCKHIYRLAIELGLMNYKVDSDINAIKHILIKLDDTIDIVEKLSENAQHALLDIAKHAPGYKIVVTPVIMELFECGIVIDAKPDEHELKFGKKTEIAELLNMEKIPFDKKANKSVLEELCLKYIPEKTHEKFDRIYYVSIQKNFSAQNIHWYLLRKYEKDIIYKDGILPNDHITAQLIKRGYYSQETTG